MGFYDNALYKPTYLLHTHTIGIVFRPIFSTTAMYTVSPFVS